MGEVEGAWAAGLFEGEGTVFYTASRNRVTLALAMTDESPVRRFADITGARVSYLAGRGDYKPVWRAELTRRQGVRDAFEMFRPWLSPRRVEQFETALSSLIVHRVRQGESGFDDCGSTKPDSQTGYRRHKGKGEEPCDSCKEAYRRYMRDWDRRRRACT